MTYLRLILQHLHFNILRKHYIGLNRLGRVNIDKVYQYLEVVEIMQLLKYKKP